MFIVKPFTLRTGSHAGKIIGELQFSPGEDAEGSIKTITLGNTITFDDGKSYIIKGIERQGYNDPLEIGKPIGLLLEEIKNN
jgi:hypothetical protein